MLFYFKETTLFFPCYDWNNVSQLKVEERAVSVEELLEADEVFCTGTAVVVSPVGSITYLGKR
jgi:branched-subunit amino acid aminotransferase/4-amino-4-deoxychorismate lyase